MASSTYLLLSPFFGPRTGGTAGNNVYVIILTAYDSFEYAQNGGYHRPGAPLRVFQGQAAALTVIL